MPDTDSHKQSILTGITRRGWVAVLSAGLLFGAGASAAWHGTRLIAGETPVPAAAATRTVGAGLDSYSELVAQVAPSVVTIRAERRERRFFGGPEGGPWSLPQIPQPPQRRQAALGSGVIVRSDGHILTNHHVVDDAEKITVEFADRRTVAAKLIGSDAASDLAVLKVEAGELRAMGLGDSDAVDVGDVVLALGNPLGVGQTVTMGIISAKSRATGFGDGSYEDFLQTDAPINSGNSGGALVNTRGQLVGINSQILSPSGGNIGIGFAIPASMARDVMQQLIEHGTVRRAQLGVTAQTIDSALASSLGLKDVRGALVSDIAAGSPAEKAQLRRGDVILAVDGHPIADSNGLRNRISSLKPRTSVALTVLRDGNEQILKVTLGELAQTGRPAAADGPEAAEGRVFGLRVETLTRERAVELGVKAASGVVVAAVTPGSPAADAGLQAGDVIEQVDRKPVTTADELRAALGAKSDRPALLLVHRKDQSLFLTVTR